MADNDLRRNGAGYRDDTAFKAISNIIREERKAKKRDRNNSSKGHDNNSGLNGGSPMDRSGNNGSDDA